jgi:hypothetical protein
MKSKGKKQAFGILKRSRSFRFLAPACLLLLFWVVASGCCFLLSNAIVTAICQPAIQAG